MIKAPSWIKNPKATVRGWVDAKTGEMLKVMRMSQADVDAFNGVKPAAAAPAPAPAPAPEPAPVVEKPAEPEKRVVPTPTAEENELDDISDEIAEMRRRALEQLKKS